MKDDVIRGAAQLFYVENVEGEPLDQDTPIECFIAGAKYVIKAQKNRNNYNILRNFSYKTEKQTMDDLKKYLKIAENMEKIIKITGFYVTAAGDPSVGINQATWEVRNDFYFDNPEELQEFRKEIKSLFEFHCGEVVSILTFEEQQAMLDDEERMIFEQYPVHYLIKDGSNYKQAGSTASYGSGVGDGIHLELPNWIDENRKNGEDRVIKSTDDEYWQILRKAGGELETEISNEEYRLKIAKRNLALIEKEFRFKKK